MKKEGDGSDSTSSNQTQDRRVMRALLVPGLAALAAAVFVAAIGVVHDSTAPAALPNPEDGEFADGTYVSNYFNLSYRLPQGWAADMAGPAPSASGYYVLGSWIPNGELDATILLAAQDTFFAGKSGDDAKTVAADFRETMASVDGMTIDHEPSEVTIGKHVAHRVDFSGVGLYRATFAVEIRCHIVSFNLTARDRESLERLAQSLDKLAPLRRRADAPHCVRDHVAADNIIHRVEPDAAGLKAAQVPVRLVVARDGSVRHVHVINATAAQKRSIEDALRQWKFKPYMREGRAVDVETGVVIGFKRAEM